MSDLFNAVLSDLSENPIKSHHPSSSRLAAKSIAVKNNIHIKGQTISCASGMLENYTAVYNATVIDRILDAGGAINATTNMDEFAMGSSSEHSIFGAVKNPIDSDRVAGGSSGGSAVAVASGFSDLALGSDTGGSVRQPAAFCGIYGLKPTYGRVSRFGLVSYASSFDQIGIFSKKIPDMTDLFAVIAGHDPKDANCMDEPVDSWKRQDKPFKIGIPKEYWGEGIETEIRLALDDFVSGLESAGHMVKAVNMPHTQYAVAVYYILTTAEASSNLARYDGVQYGLRVEADNPIDMMIRTRTEGFGEEVKRRIMLGTFVLSSGYYDAYYEKAQRMRRQIQADFTAAFKQVDILLTPTVPEPAFKRGEKLDDPLTMYLSDVFTVPMSLAGVPALNIPIGQLKNGLPVCAQAVSGFFRENDLFDFAHHLKLNS